MVSDSVTAAELDRLQDNLREVAAFMGEADANDDAELALEADRAIAALRRERDRLGRIADLNGEAAEALAEQLAAALRRERDELRRDQRDETEKNEALALENIVLRRERDGLRYDTRLLDERLAAAVQGHAELEAACAKKDAALRWYADAVAGCRKVTSEGEDARRALDRDGGQLARAALAASQEAPENRITPDGEDLLAYARSGEWKAPTDKLRALYREGQRLMREGVPETADAGAMNCVRCGYPRKEHDYNGACYGLCGEFTAPAPAPAPAISGGCQVNPVSSRGCERGTKGCEVRHAPAISGEMVSVPREPTREMWAAGADAVVGYKQRHHDKVVEQVWTAMLAAAGQKL